MIAAADLSSLMSPIIYILVASILDTNILNLVCYGELHPAYSCNIFKMSSMPGLRGGDRRATRS